MAVACVRPSALLINNLNELTILELDKFQINVILFLTVVSQNVFNIEIRVG